MKMRANSHTRQGRRGAALILFTLMLPTLLIPIVGLGIDATMLYIVQAKLSAAVDGAALGAGRLLGTLADPAEIAGEFLQANFRADGSAGFWGAYNLQKTITYTPGTTKTVAINATAQVPLLFARIFGAPTATVSAYGRATRSDSRVEMIIDRSGSMTKDDGTGTHTEVITDVVNYAQGLVQKFTSGVDELGLVVFDGSGVVGYPPSNPNWDSTTTSTSTGGPDINFMNGASTDMLHAIQAIAADSGTGMADALSVAYIELQKAHMRDLAANGVDQRLNSIILFTDGVPSAISFYLNNPANSNANNMIRSTSSCTNKTITTPSASNKMQAWLAVAGPPYSTSNNGAVGMYILASMDTTSGRNSIWWMDNNNKSTAQDATNPSTTSGPFNNCGGITGSNLDSVSKSDIVRIPTQDLWGNALGGQAYRNSSMVGGSVSSIYSSSGGDLPSLPHTIDSNWADYHWGLLEWNAADSAASNIRSDANLANRPGDSQNMAIQIYTIGYSGNGGTDSGLLLRIANDKGATGYNANQPTGMYILASNTVGLQNAFATVASAILRLAQ